MSIRVVIADDRPIIRTGLLALFEGTDISVIAEAEDGDTAVSLTKQHQPNVLLLDVRISGRDGFSVVREIRDSGYSTKIVMLSNDDDPGHVARAIANGANDFLLFSNSGSKIIAAVTRVATGKQAPADTLMNQMERLLADRKYEPGADVGLTPRETQTVRHLAAGLSNREIARSLDISVETVKEHVTNVLRKLHVRDRTMIAVWAVRQGFLGEW